MRQVDGWRIDGGGRNLTLDVRMDKQMVSLFVLYRVGVIW